MIFIYTTCESKEDAERLSKIIIENKLGVCADYWSVDSMYPWDGTLTKVSQVMLLITTLESKLEEVNELISKHHAYAVPLIAGVDIRRMNRTYKEWMIKEIE